jgi:hypothetical protein
VVEFPNPSLPSDAEQGESSNRKLDTKMPSVLSPQENPNTIAQDLPISVMFEKPLNFPAEARC